MKKESTLRRAQFSPKVQNYWLLTGILICLLTVVGIPVLLIWIPLGKYFTGKYLDKMECLLKTRELVIRKGILNRVEKTIPLEKITDLGLEQGPIMRHFGIHHLKVETAGQSGTGALASLTGIVDVEDFREAVLSQRDKITDKKSSSDKADTVSEFQLLSEMRDALLRIEEKLEKPDPNSKS